ncbi:DUF305 domain-containing protein [Tabrizicola sp.]|uniref:CopM family metallochaperone n=1 Tax=Tabrizicola sp. TaxID=2005166 RepID=UPI0025D3AEAA|nr:DUF305 domain-containing protein [Tabrizicola sp.]
MTIAKTFFATALASTLLSTAVFAQDAAFKLPEQCTAAKASGGMDHSDMGHGNAQATPSDGMNAGMMGMMGMGGVDLESMPAHVKDNMGKMMVTMPAMHEGMMIENPDVAFACGMIAHHQGAIDMANVMLAHGENPQMRALADEIIAAQVGEIEQMTSWLAENAN